MCVCVCVCACARVLEMARFLRNQSSLSVFPPGFREGTPTLDGHKHVKELAFIKADLSILEEGWPKSVFVRMYHNVLKSTTMARPKPGEDVEQADRAAAASRAWCRRRRPHYPGIIIKMNFSNAHEN